MNDLPTAYPLQWPAGRPRTAAPETTYVFRRAGSRSRYTITQAVDLILAELGRMGVESVVISSNLRVRLDGRPHADQRAPQDAGAAIYFQHRGRQVCFACDKWSTVEDNLRAISLTLEAVRGMERWGAASIEATFTGYAALPAPAGANWWEVLEVERGTPSPDVIRASYRRLVKQHHPDTGGSADKFREIQEAYQAWEKTQP